MPPGVGKAMRAALGRKEPPVAEGARRGPVLLNPLRRDVFRYLCYHPCASPASVARDLGTTTSAVQWHVRRLLRGGYVAPLRDGGAAAYPRRLVGREDAPLFAALAVPPRARLLAAAFEDPGASQTELCAALDLPRQSIAKAAAALDDLGLLRIVRDGRRRRYYPTNLLAQRREANRPRARTFAEHLVRRLAEEGLAPRVLRRTPSRLLLRLTYRGQSVSLDLPTDPFATVLL